MKAEMKRQPKSAIQTHDVPPIPGSSSGCAKNLDPEGVPNTAAGRKAAEKEDLQREARSGQKQDLGKVDWRPSQVGSRPLLLVTGLEAITLSRKAQGLREPSWGEIGCRRRGPERPFVARCPRHVLLVKMLLVAMPEVPSSVLAPSSKARSP